jgi:hypothetical protein
VDFVVCAVLRCDTLKCIEIDDNDGEDNRGVWGFYIMLDSETRTHWVSIYPPTIIQDLVTQ